MQSLESHYYEFRRMSTRDGIEFVFYAAASYMSIDNDETKSRIQILLYEVWNGGELVVPRSRLSVANSDPQNLRFVILRAQKQDGNFVAIVDPVHADQVICMYSIATHDSWPWRHDTETQAEYGRRSDSMLAELRAETGSNGLVLWKGELPVE